jgi:Tfp pilus assembly protein PilV
MQNNTAMMRVNRVSLRRRGASGASLIEVLVAIAILTVGMLAILILFPAGLVSLQTAANSTNADRLGQAELEKTNSNSLQQIEAIYSNDGATANVNPAIFIQSPYNKLNATGGYSTATSAALTNGGDVDAFRYIKGEAIRVPSLNSSNVSLYTVVASPIESGTLQVNGAPWIGISGDSNNGLGGFTDSNYSDPSAVLTVGQPQYLVDYTNGEICLSPEASGSSYAEPIVFTVTDANGLTTTQYLTVPAPTVTGTIQPGQWIKLSALFQTANGTTPAVEGALPWARGTDSLVRNFTDVTGTAYAATNFTANSDPFEYQLFTKDYAPGSPSTATPSVNLGVIAFNPSACSMHGANGQPLEAVLTYRTYSWHVISEDRLINSNYGTVRLGLINLLANSAKDLLSDNTTKFTGLFSYSGAFTGDPDVIVLDMDTGYVLNSTPGVTDYTVNYTGGAVTFVNSAGEYANDHLRIYYHPANDWAVALAKPASLYVQDTNTTDIASFTPALMHYVTPLGTTANPITGTLPVVATKIYFPLVDVGKQVDIRFQYVSQNATAATTTESLYTISSTAQSAYVDLADTTAQSNAIPSGSTIVQPLLIKGASLSAVVIWKENSIWHNRTISTVEPAQTQFSPTNSQ